MKKRIGVSWLSRKNDFVSRITGERTTNGDVLLSVAGVLAFIVLTGIIGGMEQCVF